MQRKGIRILKVGADRVDDLEALARSLHAHHLTVDPAIPSIPPRDEDGWWAIRRGRYEAWLAEPDAFALLAEPDNAEPDNAEPDADGAPVGYAVVSIRDADDSHRTGERFAELQSLAVLDGNRGEGIGSALLHAVYDELRDLGIEELAIGVLATNYDAMRLYEREGFKPWVVITLGKVPPARASLDQTTNV